MARTFNGSVDAWCANTLGPSEWTLAVWASHNSTTNIGCAISRTRHTSSDESDIIYFRGDTGGDPVQYRFSNGVGVGAANHGSAFVANTLYHVCAVMASVTSHSILRDGAGKVTSATNIGFGTGRTRIVLGRNQFNTTSTDSPLTGKEAMAAFWGINLTDDEVVSLAKGFPPRRVRPQSLFMYAPMVRDLFDWRAGQPFTDGGTTVSDHPRSYGM